MATRRSRIKGIANIPQRRKTESNHTENQSAFTKAKINETDVTDVSRTEVLEEFSPDEASLRVPSPNEANDLLENATNEKFEVKSCLGNSASVKGHVELPRRRTFIKPIVNPKLLFQKSKLKLDKGDQGIKPEAMSLKTPAVEVSLSGNDTALDPLKNQTENLPISQRTYTVKQLPNHQSENIKSGSDSEYSVGPLSPTKLLNRSRIKAVPRLGHRRVSITLHGSASESEDDGRKNYKRIRTESACSVVSTSNEIQIRTDPGSPQKNKEFSSIIQRKCKRTEQSRKMAEARRHFLHKFGNQTPDKQKLTMIDLIFYNPTTNPMSQKPKKQEKEEDYENLENQQEDLEKSKQPETVCAESDEENAVPAPQIKIGANGEIVVDEKSLIIENVETKREREKLQKSKIVDGDFDTGYGIYKREKRSKDWSKEETLRFYKALNTLGTDFTLMLELFSGRSRRELKMKFKKEERVNRPLVDKALTQPVQFDITELRKEAIEEQRKTEHQNEMKSQKLSTRKKMIPYRGQGKKVPLRQKKCNKKEKQEEKPHDIYSKLEKGIACVWESDTEDESSNVTSDTCALLKPTRSGRIPKPRREFPYPSKDLGEAANSKPNDSNHLHEDKFEDLSTALQPGSIMIVSSQTPTGEPAFKVFMVTPSQSQIPITLTADMLNNLTQSVESPDAEDMHNFPESNITIPVEENNTNYPVEDFTVSKDEIEQEIWTYEHNISIPVDSNIILPEEDNDVSLCSDGKYDVKLTTEAEESTPIKTDCT